MAIGVVVNEKDYSLYTNSKAVKPVIAIIGTATKGPVNVPTLCVSQKEFKETFGDLNTKCYGTYAAIYYLAASSRVYYTRIAADTAVKAKVTIPGTADTTIVEDALVLETAEVGSFYNGYSVIISNSDSLGFDLTIKTSGTSGTVVLAKTKLSLDDTSESYVGLALKDSFINLKTIGNTSVTLTNGTYLVADGNDGSDSITDLTSKAITALEGLNTDIYELDLLTVPGITEPAVVHKGLQVCELRGDTLYIVDAPQGMTYKEVITWHNSSQETSAAFNSSFGALYWSWQYIYDDVNSQEVLVPPSVLVAPVYARSEEMSKAWYAPAGLTRGLIKNALRSEIVPDSAVVELLYTAPNNINCIITHPTAGLVVFGQKTLWREDTALDRVNVRRLVTYIKRFVKRVCQFLVFEPNDRTTWNQFEDLVTPPLESLVTNRGLYAFKVVKGADIITDADIDNYRMPGQILIKPTKSAEYIPIDIVITATGVEFSSLISADSSLSI